MNRRKAKKKVKQYWRIEGWPGNVSPRVVDKVCRGVFNQYTDAFKRFIFQRVGRK